MTGAKIAGLHGESAPAPDVEQVIAFVEQFGVPVFPCRPNDKKPATEHGFKDATRDLAQIRRWASQIRNANWAMPTGGPSGIIAVDVDVRPDEGKHGDETLARLQREHGTLPETATVLTPSGGQHYWLRLANDERVSGGAAEKLGSGLDVKAAGGYVVIPPSQINGRAYAFEASSDPGDVGIAAAPGWLIALLTAKPEPKNTDRTNGGRAVDWLSNLAAGSALHDSLRDLAAHYAASGLGFEEITRLLEACMNGSRTPRDERWRERFDEIPKLVNSAIEKYRGTTASTVSLNPTTARLGDVFQQAPSSPVFIVDEILPARAGTEAAAGGTGKTTRHQYEHVHLVNGLPLYGKKILKPGPVLILTKEDTRAEFAFRYYHLALAMRLSDVHRRALSEHIFIEDLTGGGERLAVADMGGNLRATDLAERIVTAYRHIGPSLVEIDPMNLFGPGERFVNDGEARMMETAHLISRELLCCVRFTHHVSKEAARGRFVDAHSGRGGAAGADNARFVWTFVPQDKEDEARYPMPAEAAEAFAQNRLYRLHVPKITGAPPVRDPFWIERDGFTFRHLEGAPPTAAAKEDADVEQLRGFLTSELSHGIRHTKTTLESSLDATGLSRARLRRALVVAEEKRLLVEIPLPDADRKGGRTHYLRPTTPADSGGVPAE